MSDFTLKTYGELDVIEGLSESSHVIIEENGDVKRYPVTSIGGGASSWNDLEDKPFEANIELVEIVPETSFTTEYSDEGEVYQVSDWDTFRGLKAGREYHVFLNGEEYTSISTERYDSEGSMFVSLGNESFFYESENTGEPFYITSYNISWLASYGETVTIKVSEAQEVVKQIDAKFVKGAAFNIVVTGEWHEDDSYEEGGYTVYTADKTADEIMQAYNSGRTLQLILKEEYESHQIPFAKLFSEENTLCSLSFAGYGINENLITVNISPDGSSNGNLYVDVYKEYKPIPTIQSVNGEYPDENGNIQIDAGGVASWNDLEDKPFDSNHIVFFDGENFAWDGEVVVDEYEEKYMKILDASLSKDEVIGYSCVYNDNGNIESFEIGKNDISEYENGSLSIFMDDIYIIYSDCNNYGAQFTRGVWTKCINDDYRLLKLEKEDIKKIDAKFLPENLVKKEDIPAYHTWESLLDKPFGAGATKITVTIHQKEQVPVITVDGDEKYIWNPVETQFIIPYIKILDYGVSFDAVKTATLNGELLKEEWRWSQINTNDQYTETDAIIAVYADEAQLIGGGHAAIFEKGTYVSKYAIEQGEVVIPENKTIDPKYLPKASVVADVTEAPTAEQFNALLTALRDAGYLAT